MQRWEFPRQVRGHVQVPKVLMCLRGYWVMVNGKWYKLYGGFWFYLLLFKSSMFCLGVPVLYIR